MTQKIHILAVFVLLTAPFVGRPGVAARTAASNVRYVSPSGSDAGNCASSESPCRTLQHAVNQASSGDTILVAAGTYTFNAGVSYPCPSWTSAVVCFINKDLTILGGYSPPNWAVANPEVNLSVIDGQNVHRGVVVIGYNTSHAYYLTMEGITIQYGRAQGPTGYDTSGIGGGMLVQHAAIILKDVIFRNNQAIGQNTASGDGGKADGGGLRIESTPAGATCQLQRVIFDNNQSLGGTGTDRGGVAFGALFIYDSTVVVEDSIFTNNLAQAGSSTGSGTSHMDGLNADALGGAIGIENSVATLRGLVVTGNQVKGGNASLTAGGAYGGGIFSEGAGQHTTFFSISDSYVANNTAIAGTAATGGNSAGGGLLATNNIVNIDRVSLIANASIGGSATSGGYAGPGAGGGIYIFATRSGIPLATIKNVTIANNYADQGNGITTIGNGGGGGMVLHGVNADISHATIVKNRIGTTLILGQGLLIQPWVLQSGNLPATANLNYSIIANHTEGGSLATAIVSQVGSTLTFNHSLFAGNTKDTNADGIPVHAGTINGLSTISTADSAGFIYPNAPDYNYHLRLDSAAKDTAAGSTVSIDIEGQSRPYNNIPDLGADEHWPFQITVAPGDGTLQLNWNAATQFLEGGVSSYEVLVSCPAGANPPQQGSCEEPIYTGTATSLNLTGLSNFEQYAINVYAYDSSQNLIAVSNPTDVFPTNLQIFLPTVVR